MVAIAVNGKPREGRRRIHATVFKVILRALRYPLVDDFGTFEWPNASDLEELVAGSRR